MSTERVLITGAGGFIGSHMVRRLKDLGYWVRGADLHEPEWSISPADQFVTTDLRDQAACYKVCRDMDWVFQFAADMGGMGFISKYPAQIILNNTLINVHMIDAAYKCRVKRYLFSSSACVYPNYLQDALGGKPLAEDDAYPADPQDSYGWEKLHAEHLCKYAGEAGWLDTRIVRFHNCYGPEGAWKGGREKAPAAACRKVAVAKLTDRRTVEVWGDGMAVRTFMYIEDCIDGLLRLMQSDVRTPVQLGSVEEININQLFRLAAQVAGVLNLELVHVDGPEGVRHRSCDISLAEQTLGWAPKVSLAEGMRETYEWVEARVREEI